MADIVDTETRSRMMASVRSKDTKPEREIRKRLFAIGFRYALHRQDLPGKPDLVLPKYSAVVFVHGCFWHNHGCCRSKLPDTRHQWWKVKLEGNRKRDSRAISELQNLGWRVLVIWECSIRKAASERERALDRIADRAAKFLLSDRQKLEIPRTPTRTKRKKD